MKPQFQVILQGDGEIHALLDVLIMKNETVFVAYCPGLNLSTYGESEEDVQEAFTDAVQVFLQDTHAMGSLDRVLTNLGWKASILSTKKFELPKKVKLPAQAIRSVRNEYHVQYA